MTSLRPVSLLLCLAVAATGAVSAHHSGAMFDDARTVTFTGVIKEMQWTNPHSWLLVDVRGEDGTVTTWGFEAEGPSTLRRAGIRPGDLRAGAEITVTGHPMKDGRPAAAWVDAVLADGRKLDPRKGFEVR